MYLPQEIARARQAELLTAAAVQRRALRVRELRRATRRADRAEHQLTRSLRDAARLRGEVVAEPGLSALAG
jgi:uncharacterized protein with von Willebrand factor type A (vWA) domain